jgi:hypothetical protein
LATAVVHKAPGFAGGFFEGRGAGGFSEALVSAVTLDEIRQCAQPKQTNVINWLGQIE